MQMGMLRWRSQAARLVGVRRTATTPSGAAKFGRMQKPLCAKTCVKSGAFVTHLARARHLKHDDPQIEVDITWLISHPGSAVAKSHPARGSLWQHWRLSGLWCLLFSTAPARLFVRSQTIARRLWGDSGQSTTNVPSLSPLKGGGHPASAHTLLKNLQQRCTGCARAVYVCHSPPSKVLPC